MQTTPPQQNSLLSRESEAVVKATAPVVVQNAEAITARFYPTMFADHPELLRVFNQGNQATSEQSQALAASVVAYDVHLIDPNAPDSPVRQQARLTVVNQPSVSSRVMRPDHRQTP